MSNDPQTRPQKLNLIQVLRGIAALLIALFHISIMSEKIFQQQFLFGTFQFAWTSIVFFFTLSGFIAFYVHRREIGAQSLARFKLFWIKRLIRIYPVYWVVTFGVLLMLFLPIFSAARGDLNATWIIKSLLLYPDYQFPVVDVGWTLRYEMFFYIMFSLTIILKPQIYLPIIALWLVACCAKIIGLIQLTKPPEPWFQIILSGFNLEFALGFLAAYLIGKYNLSYRKQLLISGAGLFILFGLMSSAKIIDPFPDINHLILFGIPSALIIMGAASIDINKPIEPPRFFTYLGDASYSIFLIHGPVISALTRITAKLNIDKSLNITIVDLLILVMAVSCGCFFYSFLEKPLVEFLRQKFVPSKKLSPN